MSTIDTHLNLGASYLINDIYKRFIRRETTPRHDVIASRIAMAGLLGISVYIALHMTSVSGAWKFLLTFASGAGPVWIVRWFWWRVNAWSELSAMVSSGIVATVLALTRPEWIYSAKLLTTVGISTVIWLIVTFLTPPASKEQLALFVERVRPGRFGWAQQTASMGEGQAYLGPALLRWLLAVGTFFALNFGLGSLLLKSVPAGLAGISIAVMGLIALWQVIPRSQS